MGMAEQPRGIETSIFLYFTGISIIPDSLSEITLVPCLQSRRKQTKLHFMMRAIPDNTKPFLTKSDERGVDLGKWKTEKSSLQRLRVEAPHLGLCITVHFVFVSTPSSLSPGSLSNYSWEVNKYLVSCQTQEHSLNWKLFLRNFSFTFPTHFFSPPPRITWSLYHPHPHLGWRTQTPTLTNI